MAAPAKRIDGIDFWRGFALLTIFIDHVPEKVFEHVTQQNFGFSDAAELFVFLSGVSVALAYRPRFFDVATLEEVRGMCLPGARSLSTCQPGSWSEPGSSTPSRVSSSSPSAFLQDADLSAAASPTTRGSSPLASLSSRSPR